MIDAVPHQFDLPSLSFDEIFPHEKRGKEKKEPSQTMRMEIMKLLRGGLWLYRFQFLIIM